MTEEILLYTIYGFIVGFIQGLALGIVLWKKDDKIGRNRSQ